MQRNFIFNGGYSTRYHTAEVHFRQTIADHSFGVAWLCELLTEGTASKDLIMAALAHDLAEHMVGDIPSPAKRALGVGAQFDEYELAHLKANGLSNYAASLMPAELDVLKYADMIEGMHFCLRERRLGNVNVDVIFGRFLSYVHQLVLSRNPTGEVELRVQSICGELVTEYRKLEGK